MFVIVGVQKLNVNFIPEQVMKGQRGSTSIAVLFLQPRHYVGVRWLIPLLGRFTPALTRQPLHREEQAYWQVHGGSNTLIKFTQGKHAWTLYSAGDVGVYMFASGANEFRLFFFYFHCYTMHVVESLNYYTN